MHRKILFLFFSAVMSLAFFAGSANAQVGGLSVVLDPTTPLSSVIATDSADAEFVKLKLTAIGEDINITSIKLTANASSSVSLINIKLFDGSTQLGWTVASPSSNTAIFSSYSLIRVPVNSSKTLIVKASVIGSGVASLGIQNPSTDISAVGQTSAYTIYPTPSTPVFGNAMNVGGSIQPVSTPDLTVFDIYDDNGKLSVKIGNIGSGAAPSGVGHLYIWIDDQLKWTYSLSTLYDQSFLIPGGVMVGQPQVLSGQHKIKAAIDPNNAITESNENNNTLEKTLSFGGVMAVQSMTVDLKVNGSDSPQAILYGSAFTASWISTGATYCTGYGTDVVSADGSAWTFGQHSASGSKTLYAKSASGSTPFASFHLGIQCFDSTGKSVTDLIESIPVSSAIQTTNQTASIKVISPNGGEILKTGGTYAIQWIAQGEWDSRGNRIEVNLSKGGSPLRTLAIDLFAASGSYMWTVPMDIDPASTYTISISSYVPGSTSVLYADWSNAPFSITTKTDSFATKPDLVVENIKFISTPIAKKEVILSFNIVNKGIGSAYGPITHKVEGWFGSSRTVTDDCVVNNQLSSGQLCSVSAGLIYYVPTISSSGAVRVDYPGSISESDETNNTTTFRTGVLESVAIPAIPTTPAVPIAVSGTSTVPAIPATPVYASLQEGSLIKIPGSPDVYVIKNGQKVRIQSPQEFEQNGYKWDQIREVQAELLAQIAELKAQIKQLKEELKRAGTLIKNINSPEVYVVTENGAKEHIKSAEEFAKKGYKWNQIQEVSSEELAQIPDAGSLSSSSAPATVQSAAVSNLKPGLLVKSPDSPTIYYITKTGAKKPILNPEVFNSYKENKWENVKVISQEQIGQYQAVTAIKLPDDSKIYFVKNGKKQWVKTPTAFEKMKLQWDKVEVVNKTELSAYQEGEAIE